MHATRAAVEEGIVPGGGVALLRAASVLEDTKSGDDDEKSGRNILRRALESPLRWIAANAGKEGAIVIEKVRAQSDPNYGYNAQSDEYGDLVAAGVVDPVKVVRTALQNAASIAALMLTTEATVHEIPEDTPAMPPGMPGGEHF